MLGFDGSKRQRTDDRPSASTSASVSPSAISFAANTDRVPAEPQPKRRTRDILTQVLATQERLAADVAQLQTTVNEVLGAMRRSQIVVQQTQPESERPSLGTRGARSQSPASAGGMPPTLANIISLQNHQRPDQPFSGANSGATTKKSQTSPSTETPHSHPTLPHIPPPHHSSGIQSAMSLVSMTSAGLVSLPPSAALSRASSSGTQPPRQHSPPLPMSQQQHQQQGRQIQIQHHEMMLPPPLSAPMSAPAMSSSPFSLAQYPHHSHSHFYAQQTPKAVQRLHQQSHQVQHHYYSGLQKESVSPHRAHHFSGTEQLISLPPIRTNPTSAPQQASQHRGSAIQGALGAGPSTYSPASALAAGMVLDSTPTTAKHSSPSQPFMPGFGYARIPPVGTTASTPTSAMLDSPTGPVSGLSGARISATPSSVRGILSNASSGGTLLKVEKNRFQANIRAFVDQYFTDLHNAQWDYQQSFKAPRNAHTTQQIVQAFHSNHGGTYDRIEHGLSVYFSSLKAKHRTTEDKAMLKQQRDRRRARRIKKSIGRKKVFDQSQFPFLPKEFNAESCFVPSAMSPEHTDEEGDGEVRVGTLPWRAYTFTKLFRHLDTLRPKRTPRSSNPHLSGGSAPPTDMPAFMIDPEYIAVDRAHHENHDPEDDIDMDSFSDAG
ncbi:hypothetical protein BX661DRAFT_1663 [Kickxella alabastrina]|uniref:uncharacterized protein n=1 Tax=Kickxella alabastrina TaxID=61397 RepID=UPI00221FDB3A|nr:uncharacterized protein BX661DRAFT_1663 [Kickxella alabastrina]KAI7834552.1 hypothetical protein BX661DRAFT_1663 [Kickxella alabastrina]KAJ1944958.1 hypothetical protein GGF37_001943 [Kickxella alabastrina]